MMRKLYEFLHSAILLQSDETTSGRSELIGSVFFMFIALILTAVNIAKRVEITMTIATTALFVGFLLTAYLASKRFLVGARVVILILCGAIFTMFALIGGNDGFAILWILLVPVIGSMWIGVKFGIVLSAYFQVFLIVLFYTPMSELVSDYYSATFMLRFPLLYLASFGSITFLMWQRESLLRRIYQESYFDALTGLHNRKSYQEVSDRIMASGADSELTVFSFDLNLLKYANDTFGHQAGDELLRAAGDLIGRTFKGASCFRTGGDEFVVLAGKTDAEKAIAGLKQEAAAWKGQYMTSISISAGYAAASENPGRNMDELLLLADEMMYRDKENFYRESGLPRR